MALAGGGVEPIVAQCNTLMKRGVVVEMQTVYLATRNRPRTL